MRSAHEADPGSRQCTRSTHSPSNTAQAISCSTNPGIRRSTAFVIFVASNTCALLTPGFAEQINRRTDDSDILLPTPWNEASGLRSRAYILNGDADVIGPKLPVSCK